MTCPYCGDTLERNPDHPGDDRRTMATHLAFKHPSTAADLLAPHLETASVGLIRVGAPR